jgi:hypoxanthine phosphoribosyltransferase
VSQTGESISAADAAAVYARARLLFSAEAVDAAIKTMAANVSKQLSHTNPIIMCIMNGGLITTGKLVTQLDFPLHMDYLHATRYRNTTTGHALNWIKYPSLSLKHRTVLVVDDILDEGATLAAVIQYCKDQQAQQVYSAVLTEKMHNRKLTPVKADFVGLQIEDAYVFGYGLDYKGYLRNAPGIYGIHPGDN